MKCFHCIPEFVWELTFEALKDDSAALVNCSQASLSWNKLLTSKKTDFMMSQVLPLLAKQLSFGDLKLCRIVSRNWKNAVDGLNKRAPELLPHFDRSTDRWPFDHLYKWRVMPLLFDGWAKFRCPLVVNKLSQMTNDFKIPALNPFATRVVLLHLLFSSLRFDSDLSYIPVMESNLPGDCNKQEKGFFEILELFGSHIWHLVIRVDYWIGHMSNYVRNVIKMLTLTPNLISLTLDLYTQEITYELEADSVYAGPLPLVPNITALSMPTFGTSCLLGFMTTTYGHQLESLECKLICFYPFKPQKVFEFPKLRTLKLWGPGSYLFKLSSKMTAPVLEKLVLNLDGLQSSSSSSPNLFWDLINAIGCFSSSLIELRTYGSLIDSAAGLVGYPRKLCADLEKEKPEVCQFPHMKTFRIHISFWLFPELIWVVSKFIGLEELILERGGEAENYSCKEDWKYYSEDDVVSAKALTDLWLLLPKLQKIDIAESKESRRVIKRPC